ncbi:MAG: hypothetical protein WDZ40_01620 [Candidatus Spechtbacterales bacterium]
MLNKLSNWFKNGRYAQYFKQNHRTEKDRCGCGGYLGRHGCQLYYDSNDFDVAVQNEMFMREGNLGFSISEYADEEDMVMINHLQQHGMTPEQAREALIVDNHQQWSLDLMSLYVRKQRLILN